MLTTAQSRNKRRPEHRTRRLVCLGLTTVIVVCAAMAGGAVSSAGAASCRPFTYTPEGWHTIRVSSIKTRGVRCRRAKRLIRTGYMAASSYDWIRGWKCGPGRPGWRCRKSGRTIRFQARI